MIVLIFPDLGLSQIAAGKMKLCSFRLESLSFQTMECSMVILIIVALFSVSIQGISLNGNGYELTIAISEDASGLADDERLPFLQSLQVS